MRAKLRENAPWNTLKIKQGVVLNKEQFVLVESEVAQEQIRTSLEKTVEIEGETPKVIDTKHRRRRLKKAEPEEAKNEEPKVEEPVQEIVAKQPAKKKSKKAERVPLIDNGKLTKDQLKSGLKSEIKNILLKRKFTEADLKGLTKPKLIEVYLIDIEDV